MRRRFGRGRKNRNAPASKAAAIDAAQAFERIRAAGLVGDVELEPVAAEEIAADFAAVGVGEGPSGKIVVGFSPVHGGDAALAALSVGQRLAADEGFRGDVLALAPQWTAVARRRLAALATDALPFAFRTGADASLGDAGATTTAESLDRAVGVDVAQLADALARAEDRAVFLRAAKALDGLAAKHAGSVRGIDTRLELVLLARRVAALHADPEGVRLETFEGDRSATPLRAGDLATTLDRLEGALRKRLNDRRVRDGEEGLRAQLVRPLASEAELRGVAQWPMGDANGEIIDLVGVQADGVPAVGAIREQMSLAALGAILDAAIALAPSLPALLRDVGPPLRFGALRLLLAAQTYDAAAVRAVGALALPCASYAVGQQRGQEPGLSLRDEAVPIAPAARPEPAKESESGGAPDDREPRGERESQGRRGRGRGRRGGRRSGSADRSDGARADRGDESTEEGSAVEEISLFDLADDVGRDGNGAGEREGGRSRRGRRRGRRRPGGDGSSGEDEDGDFGGNGAGETDLAADESGADESRSRRGGDRDRGRRRRRGRRRGGDGNDGDDLDDAADADDLAETLAPLDDLAALTAEPEYDEDDDDSEGDEFARRRQAAAERARNAPDLDLGLGQASEPEAELKMPRKRAAIVVHADRQSLLAGVLLARDLRQIAGLWVYEQEDLMTFFRGVTTDLPDDTPIYVIGFTASPARDALTTAALYRGRLAWFDHHEWPPEDLGGMAEAIGRENLHVAEGAECSLAEILSVRIRRSRFSDKIVELATGRFSHHDYVRWGRLWWHRLGEIAKRTGDRRSDVDPLLAGRPSDLAKEAAKVEAPPSPPEVAFVAERDFRLVHFHGFTLVVVPVPETLDVHLTARVARERFDAQVSVARVEGRDLVILGADEGRGKRGLDLTGMVEHLASKHEWVIDLPTEDFVARLRIRDLEGHPDRFDELISEIAMGRSILER